LLLALPTGPQLGFCGSPLRLELGPSQLGSRISLLVLWRALRDNGSWSHRLARAQLANLAGRQPVCNWRDHTFQLFAARDCHHKQMGNLR
jgi:hypothetical protein